MTFQISPRVLKKLLTEHKVTPDEIYECFQDCAYGFLVDSREKNKTEPRTQWFIAKTDFGRTLKVCFLKKADGIHIKTAYEPNEEEVRIYAKYSK